jgi:hypothetical protein
MVKNIKVRFYKVIANDREYFVKFELAMGKSQSLESHSEAFKAGAKEMLCSWVLLDSGCLFEEKYPY